MDLCGSPGISTSLDRTRHWVASMDDSATMEVSPVSAITGMLTSHNLADSTPRRRLSLDACSDSSTSPKDQSHGRLAQSSTRLRAPFFKKHPVPSLRLPSTDSESEDIISLLSCLSPSPSSVFDMEEEQTHSSTSSFYLLPPSIHAVSMPRKRILTDIQTTPMDTTYKNCGRLSDLVNKPVMGVTNSAPLPHPTLNTITENVRSPLSARPIKRIANNKMVRKSGLRLIQSGMPSYLRVTKRSPATQMEVKATQNEGKESPPSVKKCKQETPDVMTRLKTEIVPKPQRSKSCVEVLDAKFDDVTCSGDYSRKLNLPLIYSRNAPCHKAISGNTMASLLRGEFSGVVEKFVIVDCRYTYEFIGGHIRGAINMHEWEIVKNYFLGSQRHLSSNTALIFYCEFSQKRGPKMYNLLRECDRKQNEENYPRLHFPEIYLLDSGYKSFYANFKELCDPIAYTPMLHDDHTADLRRFRKSKSVAAMDSSRRKVKVRGLQYS